DESVRWEYLRSLCGSRRARGTREIGNSRESGRCAGFPRATRECSWSSHPTRPSVPQPRGGSRIGGFPLCSESSSCSAAYGESQIRGYNPRVTQGWMCPEKFRIEVKQYE